MTVIEGLVSTVIPVFNRGAMLREAVDSVLAQTYRPIEVIVVDDGSTDDTPAVCHDLAEQNPAIVRTVAQENRGPGMAREVGRKLALGEFIQYLDSDDLLRPRKFELQVAALRNHTECGVAYCYTRYYHLDEIPANQPWKGSGNTFEMMFPSFLIERWWDTPTPLYRRRICDLAGPWSNLRLEEDWEYDCRVAALGTRLVHCREFLADVRDHGANRLCRGSVDDAARMRHRALAHMLIYANARRAGIDSDSRYMQHYARELFLLARQCGAAGMARESRELFDLAREASGRERSQRLDFRLYRFAADLAGWSRAGRLACWADRWRPKKCDAS